MTTRAGTNKYGIGPALYVLIALVPNRDANRYTTLLLSRTASDNVQPCIVCTRPESAHIPLVYVDAVSTQALW